MIHRVPPPSPKQPHWLVPFVSRNTRILIVCGAIGALLIVSFGSYFVTKAILGSRDYRQGLVALDGKDYDLAIACFTREIQQNPSNAEAFNRRGIAYFQNEAYDEAIADQTRPFD